MGVHMPPVRLHMEAKRVESGAILALTSREEGFGEGSGVIGGVGKHMMRRLGLHYDYAPQNLLARTSRSHWNSSTSHY